MNPGAIHRMVDRALSGLSLIGPADFYFVPSWGDVQGDWSGKGHLIPREAVMVGRYTTKEAVLEHFKDDLLEAAKAAKAPSAGSAGSTPPT